jgi:nitrite reductase (NADH) small subunit
MPDWRPIAEVSACPPGACLELVVGGRVIGLFNVGGAFHALDGVCPHQGGPLGKGCLAGATLTCPWHGWQFDVSTGRNLLSATIVQASFPVRVEGGQVLLDAERL